MRLKPEHNSIKTTQRHTLQHKGFLLEHNRTQQRTNGLYERRMSEPKTEEFLVHTAKMNYLNKHRKCKYHVHTGAPADIGRVRPEPPCAVSEFFLF